MDLSKRITIGALWEEEEKSTLLSPSINEPQFEQIVRFPDCRADDYAVELDLKLLKGQFHDNTQQKTAGVIVRFSDDNHYIYAGVGGFGMRTFIGQRGSDGWKLLAGEHHEDVAYNQVYRLRVECQGAMVSLDENGRKRLSVEIGDYPTGCWGLRTVRTQGRFANITQTGPSTLKVFVVMPFTPSLNFVYETIKEVIERRFVGLACHRVDESGISTIIIDDIKDWLAKADLIVADLTEKNSNVYYEAGFAHALGKRVILIAQAGTDLAFNLRPSRTFFYKDPDDLKKQLIRAVKANLGAELRPGP